MTRRKWHIGTVLTIIGLAHWMPPPVSAATDGAHTLRLYDGIVAYLHNADGADFNLTLDVRDLNHTARGPAELLLKVYGPDGQLRVRELIEDDGVLANTFPGTISGYDHEAWYYAATYSRGLTPAVRWSAWTEPDRVAAMPKRTFQYRLEGGGAGGYRVVLVGSADHIVTLATDPALPAGFGASPDFMHGRGDQFARRYVYVPRGTLGLNLAILQMDRPAGRRLTVRDAAGDLLAAASSENGYGTGRVTFADPAAMAGQVLTVEVSDGPGDYLFSVFLNQPRGSRYGRPGGRVFAALCPDPETARALRNGAIEHDGQVYWQAYQVALHDWLKTLDAADFEIPEGLAKNPAGFISVGSNERPRPLPAENALAGVELPHSDILMHDYRAHRNRQVLNAAIREMHEGMSRIGPEDHVMRGLNLAYEMGSYSFFYHRPAWRILQQSDAPEPVKDAIRDFVIQTGDRLAFARGIELVNGNALASLMQNLRYCVEATGDPLQRRLFEDAWDRFTTGGFHDRVGVGPSGGVQESFGYDYHYGGYVVNGWRAIIADLDEARFRRFRNGILELYSYTFTPERLIGGAWSSRTSINLGGGVYNPDAGPFPWKGLPGPDFTVSVREANEFFAARRPAYYAFTYFGRITPSWMSEGFQGQVGFGGGMLNLLQVPGHGPVIASRLDGSYGQGMHLSRWRQFRIHAVVGRMTDGQPLVGADCEMLDARLEGTTVTGSGDVRRGSVRVSRAYTFADDHLACSVSLARSSNDAILGLWGGMPGHRGHVEEAYEMIPLLGFMPSRQTSDRPEHRIELLALDARGDEIGPVGETDPVTAVAVALDRGGFGVVIELDRPRPLLRGRQGTLLIELARGRTPAEEVGIEYRLLPFVGTRAAAGGGEEPLRHPLARMPAALTLETMDAALEPQPVHSLKIGEDILADVRFALAGDDLAFEARVRDPAPRQGGRPWEGSCVEVFGSMAVGAIGQVFLIPAAGDRPARALRADGQRQVEESRIRLISEMVDQGYRLKALIPSAVLAVDPGRDEILLETQVTATAAGGQPLRRATLFGSPRAYESNHRYGRFVTP